MTRAAVRFVGAAQAVDATQLSRRASAPRVSTARRPFTPPLPGPARAAAAAAAAAMIQPPQPTCGFEATAISRRAFASVAIYISDLVPSGSQELWPLPDRRPGPASRSRRPPNAPSCRRGRGRLRLGSRRARASTSTRAVLVSRRRERERQLVVRIALIATWTSLLVETRHHRRVLAPSRHRPDDVARLRRLRAAAHARDALTRALRLLGRHPAGAT